VLGLGPWSSGSRFVGSVLSQGEHSLFYFANRYSHAVVKRPKPGDFRVQEEHGGHIATSAWTAAPPRASPTR
jgi:hypothetical protein